MSECSNNDGITFELLVTIIKKYKWLMLVIPILLGSLTAAVVRFSPQNYIAHSVMFTEEHSYIANGMKMMGTMQGIDIGDPEREEDAIYPIYYPELLLDGRMQTFILNSKVKDRDGVVMSYGQYLRKNKMHLRRKDLDAVCPTELTDSLQKILLKRIKLMVDGKTFVITIDVKDSDAFVAYTICDSVERYIGRTVNEYRQKKLKDKIEQLVLVEKGLVQRTQDAFSKYSDYADKHMDATLPSVTKQADALFKQAEELKALTEAVRTERLSVEARLNDKTPPYITIQKPSIPSSKQGVDVFFMIFGVMLLSFLSLLLIFLARPIYKQIVA